MNSTFREFISTIEYYRSRVRKIVTVCSVAWSLSFPYVLFNIATHGFMEFLYVSLTYSMFLLHISLLYSGLIYCPPSLVLLPLCEVLSIIIYYNNGVFNHTWHVLNTSLLLFSVINSSSIYIYLSNRSLTREIGILEEKIGEDLWRKRGK